MGRPPFSWYGDADVGSAIQDVKKIVEKVETNKFDNSDLLELYKANAELLKALLEHEYKD